MTQLAGTTGGQYDLVTLDIPAQGPKVTTAGTARVSGNTMAICQSTTVVAIPQNCPPGSLKSYTLSVINGNVFVGNDPATSAPLPFSFQQARIGASVALLGFGTGGSQSFIIGLPDAPAIAGGGSQGASASNTTSDWIKVTSLSSTDYAYVGQSGSTDSAPLMRIAANAGPFSMLVGNRVSDGAQIYVMQSIPLTVAFGGPPPSLASGLLQVTLR